MDCPNMMRGELYGTHRMARCASYKKCNICARCENFSRYQAQCLLCESRKRPLSICDCPPEAKEAAWKYMTHSDSPLFNPDRKPGKVIRPDESKAKEWAEIAEAMQAPRRKNL